MNDSLCFENRTGFNKCFNPIAAVLTTEAGMLKAAPGRLRIVGHTVDHHAACPSLRGDPPGALKLCVEPLLVWSGLDRCVQHILVISSTAKRYPMKLRNSRCGVGLDEEHFGRVAEDLTSAHSQDHQSSGSLLRSQSWVSATRYIKFDWRRWIFSY
jgi:hypothetical protein